MHSDTFTIHNQKVAAAQAQEDADHASYISAVRHTGRLQGFLVGVVLTFVIVLIFG